MAAHIEAESTMEDLERSECGIVEIATTLPDGIGPSKSSFSSNSSRSPLTPSPLPPPPTAKFYPEGHMQLTEMDTTDDGVVFDAGEVAAKNHGSLHVEAAPEHCLSDSPTEVVPKMMEPTAVKENLSIAPSSTRATIPTSEEVSAEVFEPAPSQPFTRETPPSPATDVKSVPSVGAELMQAGNAQHYCTVITDDIVSIQGSIDEGGARPERPPRPQRPTSRRTLWTMLRSSSSTSDIKVSAQADEVQSKERPDREAKGKERALPPLGPPPTAITQNRGAHRRATTHDENMMHCVMKGAEESRSSAHQAATATTTEGPPPPTPSTKPNRQSVPPPPRRKASMWDIALSAATRLSSSSSTSQQQKDESISYLVGDEGKLASEALRFAHARHVLRTEKDVEVVRCLALDLDGGWREKLKEVSEMRQRLSTSQQKHHDVLDENKQLRVQIGQLSESLVTKEVDFETLQRHTLDSARTERDEIIQKHRKEMEATTEEKRQLERMWGLERALNSQLRVVLGRLLEERHWKEQHWRKQDPSTKCNDSQPSAYSVEGDLSATTIQAAHQQHAPAAEGKANAYPDDEDEHVKREAKGWINQLNSIPLPPDYLEALQLPVAFLSPNHNEGAGGEKEEAARSLANGASLPSLTFGQIRERLKEEKSEADRSYFESVSQEKQGEEKDETTC